MNDRNFLGPLREYFDGLSVETRALLLAELDMALLRNEDLPDANVILEELTRGLRNSGVKFERIGNPSRAFFNPLEPFLINGAPVSLRHGEVARASLGPIWGWLCREVMPKKAKSYSDLMKRALLARDHHAARGLAHVFQGEAVKGLERAIATAGSEAIRDRLVVYMAPPRAFDDLAEIVRILKGRDVLSALASRLPAKISDLGDQNLDRTLAVLDGLAEGNPDMVLYCLIIVMRRLVAPWQLIRLAFRAAGSHGAAQIARTPYAMAVGLVLRSSEDLVERAETQLKESETAAATDTLGRLAAAIKGLGEIELPAESVWGKRLAVLRNKLNKLRKVERAIAEFKRPETDEGQPERSARTG